MKKPLLIGRQFQLLVLLLLLCNFSAFAQKTSIWLVNNAEKLQHSDLLSDSGKDRAVDLMKALRRADIQTIYISRAKVSQQTAGPLAEKVRLLPRVNSEGVKKFADILRKNFDGGNVLVIADNKYITALLAELGADSPFDALTPDDHDQLFTVTIKSSGDVQTYVRYFGKKHHDNAIPQSYIMDNITPGVPGR